MRASVTVLLITSFPFYLADIVEKQSLAVATVEGDVRSGNLSSQLVRKIYSFTRYSSTFRNVSLEETEIFFNKLSVWEPPEEIQRTCPYYMAGYDYENRPIWMGELGKYDVRTLITNDQIDDVERYALLALLRIMASIMAKDTPNDEIREAVFILDMEGWTLYQIATAKSMSELVRLGQKYHDLVSPMTGAILMLNTNYPTKVTIDMARPHVGKLLENMEVFGTSQAKWLPRLLRLIPFDLIPPWYGGSPNFKPVQTFG